MYRGDRSWTVIRNTEKRKVGGSTPPLTTIEHQRKHLAELRQLAFLMLYPDCPPIYVRIGS